MSKTKITLCRYWVKEGHEAEFRTLLDAHWPVFKKAGLVADDPPHLVFRGEDKEKGVFFVEIFPWMDADAMDRAHAMPEVSAVWGPMGEACERMEFPTVERLD